MNHPIYHELPNGRKYRFIDHGEYKSGEYPTGGIQICAWDERLNNGAGLWTYIDNSPDLECAEGFLKLVSKLPCKSAELTSTETPFAGKMIS